MAAYSSTQSGDFNNSATWGGGGWPNLDGDTVTINAGHVVTYNLTTPLNTGLGAMTVNNGGTLILDTDTVIRLAGESLYLLACDGNFIARTGVRVLLKGTTAAEKIMDMRPRSFVATTATGTSGQNTITVASNANLIVGTIVSGTGIRTGAYVTNIAGTTITLSGTNTGTVSGNLTAGNYVDIQGSDGMVTTTLSQAITTDQYQQGYLTFTSVTDFAVGDWIAVFKNGCTNATTDRNDEGFLIHDIDGSNVYIREFVGPTTTITSATTDTITVANAKIFRTWQKLIFGTGANRNVLGITSINYETNTLTLSGTITGTVTGLSVYTTGPLQTKNTGDRVRKAATTVATQAANNATQITLASAAGFAVDDEILISSLWNTDQTSYTDEYPEKRNITAISGNTVTINSSLGYISYVGAFVTKVTRDIKVISDYERTLVLSTAQTFAAGDVITQAYSRAKGVVKTATSNSTTVIIQDQFGEFITGTTNSPWISKNGTPLAGNVSVSTNTISTAQGHAQFSFGRGAINTANQLSCLFFKDVQVMTFGNVNTTGSRLYIRGYWSDHANPNGGTEIEGITYCKPNQGDNFNYQDNGIFFARYMRDMTVRCCVAWNTVTGIRFNESYEFYNVGAFNNYSARAETAGWYWEHVENAGTIGGAAEMAYNYIHRCDDYGIIFSFVRTPGRGLHHNWVDVTQLRAILTDLTYNQGMLYQNRFQHYFEPIFTLGSNEHNFIYNEWIPANSLSDFAIDGNFQRHNQSVSFTVSVASLEHNYEYDAVTVFIPNGMRVWDQTEQAWRCTFDDDSGVFESGLAEVFYIPSGAVLKARATIKLDPAFNGTAPKLAIRGAMDRFYVGTNGTFAGDQPFRGYLVETNFSAANTTTYQSVEIEMPAKPWGRTVTVGVINVNSNASEGWWEKPTQVKMSYLPGTPFMQTGYNKFSAELSSGTSFTETQVRLTGSRLL
jgi:hypothetical protein